MGKRNIRGDLNLSRLTPMFPVTSSRSAAYVLGPQLTGACIGALLTGVIAHQFSRYIVRYPAERRGLRAYVGLLMLGTVATTVLDFLGSWQKIVLGAVFFGTPDIQITGSNSMLPAFLAIYVQSFYLHRLYRLSNRNWPLVGLLTGLLVLAFSFSIAAVSGRLTPTAMAAADNAKSLRLYNLHLAFILVGDFLLTLTTVGYLIYYRKRVLPRGASLMTTLIRVTFQSAAPATCCVIVEFAISISFPNPAYAPVARVSAAVGTNMALSKLWAVSLLGTLNSRPAAEPRKDASDTSVGWQSLGVVGRRSRSSSAASAKKDFRLEIRTHTTSSVVRDPVVQVSSPPAMPAAESPDSSPARRLVVLPGPPVQGPGEREWASWE
ncbi:hypothetical protein MIND_00297700 [Mycena indigotica]|uniref:DUF6534 domain-containing protein n=1 Tax=Mycena indigotica TaxID=2126181 RepID=A0A8H6T1N0_9AGAR|nr:uncharacterized protein MIND_00297700 [Mycena indigotica]KAF7309274.1 hypothetical protein MIND_00297700 [Mycena indigotica]